MEKEEIIEKNLELGFWGELWIVLTTISGIFGILLSFIGIIAFIDAFIRYGFPDSKPTEIFVFFEWTREGIIYFLIKTLFLIIVSCLFLCSGIGVFLRKRIGLYFTYGVIIIAFITGLLTLYKGKITSLYSCLFLLWWPFFKKRKNLFN